MKNNTIFLRCPGRTKQTRVNLAESLAKRNLAAKEIQSKLDGSISIPRLISDELLSAIGFQKR